MCKKLLSWFKRIRTVDVLPIVSATNKANPYHDKKFKAVTPKIHQNSKALDIVNMYGHLSTVYCRELVRLYEDKGFPFEIEEAILELRGSNLIYYLTDAGHKWSEEAQQLMKEKHPQPYQHNVVNRHIVVYRP